jgi:hypothetical protein
MDESFVRKDVPAHIQDLLRALQIWGNNFRIAQMASRRGCLALLEHFVPICPCIKAPDDFREFAIQAAYAGSPECLQFVIDYAQRASSRSIVTQRLLGACVHGGSVACYRIVRDLFPSNALRLEFCVVTEACLGGNVDMLKHLVVSENFRIPSNAMVSAIRGGSLECLQFLHRKGARWTSNDPNFGNPIKHCIIEKRLDLLDFALKHGCPLSCGVNTAVEHSGNAHIVKYLHKEQSCGINLYHALCAAQLCDYECFEYCYRNHRFWYDEDRDPAWMRPFYPPPTVFQYRKESRAFRLAFIKTVARPAIRRRIRAIGRLALFFLALYESIHVPTEKNRKRVFDEMEADMLSLAGS